MKFKERPPREQEPEPVERSDVHVAANRCPYCHEDVEAKQSVVCQKCLSRHHGACWREAGSCSACHGTRLMSVSLGVALGDGREREIADLRQAIERESWLVRVGLGVAFAVLGAFPLVGVAALLWRCVRLFPENIEKALLGGAVTLACGIAAYFVSGRMFQSARLRLWGYEDPSATSAENTGQSPEGKS